MANPSPLRYPGGKYKTIAYIRELVQSNNCSTYIEPFAGGAGVAFGLLLEGTVKKIIINDYDRSIYAFWHSVVNNSSNLIQLIKDTDVNLTEWKKQKNIQLNKENQDLLSLGFSTLFLNRTNHSGIIKGGVMGGKKQKGNYKLDCRFNKEKLIQKIELIANQRNSILLYNLDALDFIDIVIKKTKKSFTFFDPPYFEKGPSLYTDFYEKKDHEELAMKIRKELRHRYWIVTYDNNLRIKKMYDNYRYFEYYLSYTAQNKSEGIEYMFFSHKTKIPVADNVLKLVSNKKIVV